MTVSIEFPTTKQVTAGQVGLTWLFEDVIDGSIIWFFIVGFR